MKLGITQRLKVTRSTDYGVYLADVFPSDDTENELNVPDVLLPKNQAGDYCKDDIVNVFIYKDSEDRPVATTATPLITLGEVAVLKCKEVTRIGAFLDWGLTKDLLLPFREQTKKIEKGEDVLVALYIDKTGRLCATMKVYHYLKKDSPYSKDDRVSGTVYEVSGNFGTFVAVDNMYSAMIPKKELFHPIPIGARISARVVKVLDDGKLTLSCREKSFVQMDADARLIMLSLKSAGGFLPFHDKSTPEEIKERFGLSKAAFKRAIGTLYKNGEIVISETGITLNNQD
ncbi:MAG: RNA-binding protein [Lachnospiraceae bacterium]|nr:RNA-binding protein [Lachnospiraceae bacterium]